MDKKIAGIVGSLRKESLNRKMANALVAIYCRNRQFTFESHKEFIQRIISKIILFNYSLIFEIDNHPKH